MQQQRYCASCHLLQNHKMKFCSYCGNHVDREGARQSTQVNYEYQIELESIKAVITKQQNNYELDHDGYILNKNNPYFRPLEQHIERLKFHSEFMGRVRNATRPFTFLAYPLMFLAWIAYIGLGFFKVNEQFEIIFVSFLVHAAVLFGLFSLTNLYIKFVNRFFRNVLGKDYEHRHLDYPDFYKNLEDIYSAKGKLKCVYCGHAGVYVKGAYHGKHNPTAGYVSCSKCTEILFYT